MPTRRWAALLVVVMVVVLWWSAAPGRQNVTPILGMPWSDDDKTNQALQTIDQCLGGLEINQCGGVGLRPVAFANLGPVVPGIQYCFDCTAANPCTGAGTGAVARGEGGVWNCGGGAGGGGSFATLTGGTNTAAHMTCGTGCIVDFSGSGVVSATQATQATTASTANLLAGPVTPCAANIASTGISTQGVAQGCFQPLLPAAGPPVANQVGVFTGPFTVGGFGDFLYTNSPPTFTVGITSDGSMTSRCTQASNTCKADFPDDASACAAPGANVTRACSVAGRLGQIVSGGAWSAFSTAASADVLTNKNYNTAATGNNFQINGRQITAITGNTGTLASFTGSTTNSDCVNIDAAGNLKDAGTTCGGGSTPRLDQVLDPNVAKAFTMGTNTLGFTYGNITAGPSLTDTFGALSGTPAVSQYVIQDTTVNTNTGPLLDVHTVGSSTALPIRITAGGTANGVSMLANGTLAPIGTGAITPLWNTIASPGGNQTLSMGNNHFTTWTWGTATGASTLFTLTDGASNTGTGVLARISTLGGSTELPLLVTAQAANGFEMDATGNMAPLGAGKISPRLNDVTNTGAAWVVTDGFGTQINITSGASGSFNLNVSSTNTGAQDKIIDNDFNGNTGTGFLRRINTVGTSTMKPLGVFVGGTTNGWQTDANAVTDVQGTGTIQPSTTLMWLPSNPTNDNAIAYPGTANQMVCQAFVAEHSIRNATKLGWGIAVAASTACSVSLFDGAGNVIANSGAQNCSVAGPITVTGLTAFTVNEGHKYFLCTCNNGTTGSFTAPNLSTATGRAIRVLNAFVQNTGLAPSNCTAGAPVTPLGLPLTASNLVGPLVIASVE